MRSAQQWFDEYGESHRNPANKFIHWICVPLIFWSVLALLWELPVPDEFSNMLFVVNWAIIVAMLVLIWYLILSATLAAGMLVFTVICLMIVWAVDANYSWPLWIIALVVFALAWAGQFVGHKIEGKKPSFFKDLQFLLIGPAWLLGYLYRLAGIKY